MSGLQLLRLGEGAVGALAGGPRWRVLPVTLQGQDPRLFLLHAPESAQAAAFRVLRHRLDVWSEGAPLTLAVCAPKRRCGASTAAANLALAFAESSPARPPGGGPAVLIEGHLRHPALADLFGFQPPECLGERLGRHRDPHKDPFWAAEVTPGLQILACDPLTRMSRPQPDPQPRQQPRDWTPDGPPLPHAPPHPPAHPVEVPLSSSGRAAIWLSPQAAQAAVAAARDGGARHVIIDAPPVLGAADANLIEEIVDVVVLVARARATTAAQLRAATDQLGRRKLLGVVLLDG